MATELRRLTLRNAITGSVTWDDDVEAALAAADADPSAPATPAQMLRSRSRDTAFRGVQRALWIATGEIPPPTIEPSARRDERPYAGKYPATIERIYYTVPTTGSAGTDYGDSLTDAVEAAKATVERVVYRGQKVRPGSSDYDSRRHFMEDGHLTVYTRAFIHLRLLIRWANGHGSTDLVLDTTEVYLLPLEREVLAGIARGRVAAG